MGRGTFLGIAGCVLSLGCGSSDAGSTGADLDSSLGDGAVLDEGLRDTTTGADTTAGSDTSGADRADTNVDTATDGGTADTDDAGAMCFKDSGAACFDGLSCLCCAAGGPRENCTCSTKCTTDADCTDPTRPKCNQQAAGVEGFCTSAAFVCCWLCK